MPDKEESQDGKSTGQLNVRIPHELLTRVSGIAALMDKTLAGFVAEVLDERTKDHKADADRIRNREKITKRWQP